MHIPVGHIDDPRSMAGVLAALRAIHGPGYGFAVGRWDGEARWQGAVGQVVHRFIVRAEEAQVALQPGQFVRGAGEHGPYRPLDGALAAVVDPIAEALWPGDVVSLDSRGARALTVTGCGVYFEVSVEPTTYVAPTVALLRNLADKPGGCAAYPGAFRREALPPARPPADAADRRGANRVNEHTLDMRIDRSPPPIRHYHGPVPAGDWPVNHSETALVLPRAAYGLPEVAEPDRGWVVVYRRPAEDPADVETVAVSPGSVVVTPAAADGVMGHCFENAFAMLVAIPGFVAPYNFIHNAGVPAFEAAAHP